jgi:hypothetical protein
MAARARGKREVAGREKEPKVEPAGGIVQREALWIEPG